MMNPVQFFIPTREGIAAIPLKELIVSLTPETPIPMTHFSSPPPIIMVTEESLAIKSLEANLSKPAISSFWKPAFFNRSVLLYGVGITIAVGVVCGVYFYLNSRKEESNKFPTNQLISSALTPSIPSHRSIFHLIAFQNKTYKDSQISSEKLAKNLLDRVDEIQDFPSELPDDFLNLPGAPSLKLQLPGTAFIFPFHAPPIDRPIVLRDPLKSDETLEAGKATQKAKAVLNRRIVYETLKELFPDLKEDDPDLEIAVQWYDRLRYSLAEGFGSSRPLMSLSEVISMGIVDSEFLDWFSGQVDFMRLGLIERIIFNTRFELLCEYLSLKLNYGQPTQPRDPTHVTAARYLELDMLNRWIMEMRSLYNGRSHPNSHLLLEAFIQEIRTEMPSPQTPMERATFDYITQPVEGLTVTNPSSALN